MELFRALPATIMPPAQQLGQAAKVARLPRWQGVFIDNSPLSLSKFERASTKHKHPHRQPSARRLTRLNWSLRLQQRHSLPAPSFPPTMASMNQCLASLARLSLATPSRPLIQTTIPKFLAPAAIAQQQTRTAAGRPGGSGKKKDNKKKKRQFKAFRVDRLDKMQQFSLCDAIR